jgi:hypothetical protein
MGLRRRHLLAALGVGVAGIAVSQRHLLELGAARAADAVGTKDRVAARVLVEERWCSKP